MEAILSSTGVPCTITASSCHTLATTLSFQTFPMQQKWVLPLSIAALVIPLIIIYSSILSYTKGTFAYPLDDAFIHMGIAKNLAFNHVWGISKYEFTSASSSILYPPLLAIIFFITGANIFVPFVVNLIAGIWLLIKIQAWLSQQLVSPLAQLLILLTAIYLTPLPVIIAIGMEHTLHILFFLLFIFKFTEWITINTGNNTGKWKPAWPVFVYGMLVTATRYEGMFLIVIACCILLYYRQIELAFELGVICMLPIVGFGLYSMNKGNYFLPNSVVLKSTPIPLTANGIWHFLKNGIFQKLFYGQPSESGVSIERLLMIIPITYLLFFNSLKQQLAYRIFLIIIMLATFFHLAFANSTWFFRYEAYLITPSIIILGTLIAKYTNQIAFDRKRITIFVAVFLSLNCGIPFIIRSNAAFTSLKGACLNIYDQNYHMGRFLHRYYNHSYIAVNDLGCPSFYFDGKILDLWGLGNIEVANSKRYNYYNTAFLDSIIKKERSSIAVVFDRLYSPDLLHTWHKVATWHINNIVVAGDPNLCFYAIESYEITKLKLNLQQYQSELPPDVKVIYEQ